VSLSETLVAREQTDKTGGKNCTSGTGNYNIALHSMLMMKSIPLNNGLLPGFGSIQSKRKCCDSRFDSLGEKIAGLGRETQKFLQFCIEMFRQALMMN
jgi:DNA polymerase-3 subunit delta'